ncbi:hypothetical protein ABIA30_003176 [Mycobacterium sp. MAA66]|uniref:DUF7373 family lipoprotein n=1 Tax=Mycobacterium sp. MAA66 TaxID=3156297 RepID=UPI00351318BD
MGVTALLVAGCSHDQSGQAEKAQAAPQSAAVDLNLLGSGNFPIKPVPTLGSAGSGAQGAMIDARRMADSVVGPWEVDPTMVVPTGARAMVVPDPAALADVLPAAVAAAALPYNLIYGFTSDRQNSTQGRLMNTVLRFDNPAAAVAAAADMSAAATAEAPTVNHPAPIPGHPDARATTFTYNLDTDGNPPVTLYSFTPHGTYVLVQLAHSETLDSAAALVRRTLDAQQPRIDQFVPADPANFPTLPVDPSGLLAHTMSAPTYPDPPGAKPYDPKIGIYLPHAALHFQDSPIDAQAAFAAAGMSEMTFNQTIIYRTRDAASATKLVDALSDIALRTEPSAHPANAVDFLPGSRCVQSEHSAAADESNYFCFAALNELTIAVHDPDPTGARQETAAQYKMLLAK